MGRKITLSRGGTNERTIEINEVEIPDIWWLISEFKLAGEGKKGLKFSPENCRGIGESLSTLWHNAYDLKRHIQEEGIYADKRP